MFQQHWCLEIISRSSTYCILLLFFSPFFWRGKESRRIFSVFFRNEIVKGNYYITIAIYFNFYLTYLWGDYLCRKKALEACKMTRLINSLQSEEQPCWPWNAGPVRHCHKLMAQPPERRLKTKTDERWLFQWWPLVSHPKLESYHIKMLLKLYHMKQASKGS